MAQRLASWGTRVVTKTANGTLGRTLTMLSSGGALVCVRRLGCLQSVFYLEHTIFTARLPLFLPVSAI